MKRMFAVLLACLACCASAADVSTLRDFDAQSLAKIKQAQAGRPFVLALWSIHCEPCLRELPQWRALQVKYPEVPIILVAADAPKERKKVTSMLSRYGVDGVQTWAFADEFEEKVRYSIDPSWRGELPRTYLFDAAHKPEARSGAELPWLQAWMSKQR